VARAWRSRGNPWAFRRGLRLGSSLANSGVEKLSRLTKITRAAGDRVGPETIGHHVGMPSGVKDWRMLQATRVRPR
jgi:hypothetical protein